MEFEKSQCQGNKISCTKDYTDEFHLQRGGASIRVINIAITQNREFCPTIPCQENKKPAGFRKKRQMPISRNKYIAVVLFSRRVLFKAIKQVKQPNPTLPKLKGFKVAQLNIASLPKHYEELFIYMRDEPFDIGLLTLNETRLDSTFLDLGSTDTRL